MTARSAELAEALARRMRAPGTRPQLVHRSGLPDPAGPGTVRGLAAAAPARFGSAHIHASMIEDDRDIVDAAAAAGGSPVSQPRVLARRPRAGQLTAIDDALAASLRQAMQPPAAALETVEEAPAQAPVGPAPPDAGPAGPQRSQRTVIRRRADGVRPLGLQAPLRRDADVEAPVPQNMTAHDAERAPAVEKPSRAVAAAVGRLHRADVSDVRVRRDEEAERLTIPSDVRAVTRGGEVFIPAAEGSLEGGRASGLLAHELTHVIQQRRLGRSVPLEHSPAGRRLENEAVMTERHVRGDLAAPAPPPAADPPARAVETPAAQSDEAAAAMARDIQDEMVASGRAVRGSDGSLVFPGGGGRLPEQQHAPVQPGEPVQHAGDEGAPPPSPSAGSAERFPAPPSPGLAASPQPEAAPGPWVAAPSSAGVPPAQWDGSVQAPDAIEPAAAAPPASSEASPADTAPAPSPAAPEVDLDDLARRVYGRVRTQLRSELLIDRERAGLLTDFR